jgi:crotonobetainyl-CoA:carnitine CoA-transferase CaiB-like acyl-CoA transferase
VPTTLPAADMGASLYSVLAVILALYEKLARPAGFTGRHLDVALSDCTLALMEPRIAEALSEQVSADALIRPGYGVYLTADEQYVSIGALEDHFWERLVRALQLAELSGRQLASYQQRRRHIGQIEQSLRARVATFDRAALIELLVRHDVPVAPVNDLHEPVRDPHFKERGMIYQVPGECQPRVAEWPAVFDAFASRARLTAAPKIGEHSREVLAEHGLGADRIDALIESGVVRQAPVTWGGIAPCAAGLAEDAPDLTGLSWGVPDGPEASS